MDAMDTCMVWICKGRERREGITHLEERKYTILHTEQILQAATLYAICGRRERWEAGIVARKI
jgi:hypothetical protein